jgi:hypothetical protein
MSKTVPSAMRRDKVGWFRLLQVSARGMNRCSLMLRVSLTLDVDIESNRVAVPLRRRRRHLP